MVKDLIGNEIKIGSVVVNVTTKNIGNVIAIYQRMKGDTVIVSNKYEVISYAGHGKYTTKMVDRKVWCRPRNLAVLPEVFESKKKPMKAVL